VLEAARDDAEDLGDPDLLARVYALLLRIRTMLDENYADREYRAVMDRAYALALQVRTAELRAFLQGMMGQVLRSAERYSAAVELAGGSVGLLEDAGRFGEAGFNAAITADVEASQGHFDEAARWIARGAALAEASGNPNVIADVELMKGRIAAARGELETALTHTRLGMETAEGAGNIQHTLVGNFLVADQQLRRGDAAAAIPHLERTFELGAYRNAEAIVGLGNAWLASARAHLGDLDPNVFSGPLEQAQAGRSRSGEAAVRLQRAIALAGSPEPDWDQAFDDFERAIALFASIDARPDQARAVHAYANAPDAAGRNEESRSQLETAMTMFDEMGIRPAAVPASEQPLVSETRATSIPIVEPTGPTRRPTPFRSIEPAFAAAGRRRRASHRWKPFPLQPSCRPSAVVLHPCRRTLES
jgi:tetratricopeptide (TPR) repeat protein